MENSFSIEKQICKIAGICFICCEPVAPGEIRCQRHHEMRRKIENNPRRTAWKAQKTKLKPKRTEEEKRRAKWLRANGHPV